MRSTSLVVAGLVALARAASECPSTYDGKFEITVVEPSDLQENVFEPHECTDPNALILTLKDGVLLDAENRIGSIVSNHQLQFDAHPQVNALGTSGFSVCDNGFLSLNGSTDFFACLSGDFSNLYDKDIAKQCFEVNLIAMACDDNGGLPACNYPPVSQISDGQIQAPTDVPPAPAPTDEPDDGFTPTSNPAPQQTTEAPQTTSGSGSSPEDAPPVPTGLPTSGAFRAIVDARVALAVAMVGLLAL